MTQQCITKAELEGQLSLKADVTDVSSAITQTLLDNDLRKEVDLISNKLAQYRHEIDMD